MGFSVQAGVSVQGEGLSGRVSVRGESLSRKVLYPGGGSLLGGVCPGGMSLFVGSLSGRPPYGNVQAVCILLECILVNLVNDPAGDLSALACMVTSLLMG